MTSLEASVVADNNAIATKASEQLRACGILGVEDYIRKLRSRTANQSGFRDLLSEGRAAFILARAGFRVTMQDRPDLRLEYQGELIGAEVKRFQTKQQDDIDEQKLDAVDLNDPEAELVEYGDTTDTEGKPACHQVEDVLIKKCATLLPDCPNIVVIHSDSHHCVEDSDVQCGTRSFSDHRRRFPDDQLKCLNGVLLFGRNGYHINGQCRYTRFFETDSPWNFHLSLAALSALHSIVRAYEDFPEVDIH